jgi:FdhD protein
MDTTSFTSDRFPTKDPSRSFRDTPIVKVEGFQSRLAEETLAVEEPLEIQLVHGPADARSMKSISVTMRTPGDDFELAAGFLMTEGVVRDIDDVEQIVYAAEDMAPTPEAREHIQSALP